MATKARFWLARFWGGRFFAALGAAAVPDEPGGVDPTITGAGAALTITGAGAALTITGGDK